MIYLLNWGLSNDLDTVVDSLPSRLSVPAVSDKMVCSVDKGRMQWVFQEKKFMWAECILRGSHWVYYIQYYTQWSLCAFCSCRCTRVPTPFFPVVVFKEFEGTNPQTV